MSFQSLTLLGSTGSIGRQTLEVVRHLGGAVRVEALGAGGRNVGLLAEQVLEFAPPRVHISDASRISEFRSLVEARWAGEIYDGEEGLAAITGDAPAELVLIATVGWAGLSPALAAIKAGRAIALANKEALVCGGALVMAAARERGTMILPVDSEHNAIFQCLSGSKWGDVEKMILTCSGGPFRNCTAQEINDADASVTLRHPTWRMGNKVTVDSATLMNKGFEVIEAHHLFSIPFDKIEVLIHPQSVVHSMVEFIDGSVIAQLGATDMRLPIQYALTYPERMKTAVSTLKLDEVGTLTFDKPDHVRFPALRLAYDVGNAGGSAPCVLNAANEIAVQLHLDGKVMCGAIPRILTTVMERHSPEENPGLARLREWDAWGRDAAASAASKFTR